MSSVSFMKASHFSIKTQEAQVRAGRSRERTARPPRDERLRPPPPPHWTLLAGPGAPETATLQATGLSPPESRKGAQLFCSLPSRPLTYPSLFQDAALPKSRVLGWSAPLPRFLLLPLLAPGGPCQFSSLGLSLLGVCCPRRAGGLRVRSLSREPPSPDLKGTNPSCLVHLGSYPALALWPPSGPQPCRPLPRNQSLCLRVLLITRAVIWLIIIPL